ncbi:Undecaprenyl-diphosphatase OS=Bosea thiooxidans OX=53254 GN=uppP PE=3 SV=1 [Bosea thiooxidans]|uniref:Undecaprenyl-diphosphatase n=1 Tax=Bosea thiooxidans TaxID=53254 RepID=A0A1T5AN88_9HYPH|nr:undecaprenyl-diphosphate phosphatase [Bosea thiooxidans]SKB36426.1 undecaprenyl-diphosphatase [Bosea thiooxidans]
MATACSTGLDIGFATLDFGQIIVLGLVQGVTELLPISSTAHMRVVPALLGWPDPGSAFSALMQLAALAAVVSYFRRDIRSMAGGALDGLRTRQFTAEPARLALGVVLATIPIVIAGVALAPMLNRCGSPLRSLGVIGAASLAMALLLAATEWFASHRRTATQADVRDFLLIGLAQIGALIPGVSRSGSTLTAAMALGFKRAEAARLSFLLGLPAITLAGLKEAWEIARAGIDAHAVALLAVGLVAGSLASFVAISGLMRYLERMSSWIFVIYRAGMGVFLLWAVAARWPS